MRTGDTRPVVQRSIHRDTMIVRCIGKAVDEGWTESEVFGLVQLLEAAESYDDLISLISVWFNIQ